MAKQPKKTTSKKSTKKVSIAEYTRRREVWLAALESGKFKQTTAQLHNIDEKGKHSFCCLGVACKVLAKEVGIESVRNGDFDDAKSADVGYRLKGTQGTGENGNLPMVVADYLGMYVPKDHREDGISTSGSFKGTRPNGKALRITGDIAARSLIDLNDNHGFSFKKIAAFIRENPHLVWKNGTYKPVKKIAAKLTAKPAAKKKQKIAKSA